MSGLLKPLVAGPARHVVRLLREPGYRTLAGLEARLGRRPRYSPFRVRADRWTLEGPDAASFLASWREIVVDGRYDFPWTGPPPRILDLGANVGLSVLHFLAMHPGAEVLAVEADPVVFGYLEKNLAANGGSSVERVQRAAWSRGGRVAFRSEGADAGRVAGAGPAPASGRLLDVEALDLPALLAERSFDMIKMDIEGAETEVVPACWEGLRAARFVAVEYHSSVAHPQALGRLLQVLEDCGFRVHAQSVNPSPRPFLEVRTEAGFDMQVNLFGWKP